MHRKNFIGAISFLSGRLYAFTGDRRLFLMEPSFARRPKPAGRALKTGMYVWDNDPLEDETGKRHIYLLFPGTAGNGPSSFYQD